MEDLTTGPLTRHLLKTTSFMLVTMVFQTLYFLIDLYWVGRLGTHAVAAVGIAGNFTFIVLALTRMLGVGTTTVVSHAVGRKDKDDAQLMFNQAQVLAVVTGIVFLIVGMLVRLPYTRALSPDAETAALAAQYLLWFIPAMALQFLMVAAGAALRAVGNFKAGMIVSTGSVLVNMVLAPFLIFGWVTGRPFGVAGAAIASLVAVVVAVVWFATYFLPKDSYLQFVRADLKPRFALWRKMLAIGLPAGFEFAMMGVYLVIVYAIARPFGAAAQAGFGIGQRVIQALFMPAVALGFSVAPVAGQNFGARSRERVIDTFRKSRVFGIRRHGGPRGALSHRARSTDRHFLQGPGGARRRHHLSPHCVVELRCIRFDLRCVEHVPGDGKHGSVAGGFRYAHSARRGAGYPAFAHSGLSACLDMVPLGWRGDRPACAQHAAAATRVHSPAGLPFPTETGRQHCCRVSDGGGGVRTVTSTHSSLAGAFLFA